MNEDDIVPTAVSQEISSLNKRIEELEATQAILQTLVDRMPTAVALIRGSDLCLQFVNPAYQAIAPGKEMVGHTLGELWTETGQDLTAICRRVLETGEPHQVEDELNTIRRSPDGPLEQAYFNWSLHRVRLPGEQGWGLLNAAWETTARKQGEDALGESRRKYLDLLETTSDFIWEMDSQGRYTYCSPQMESLWGIKPEEMIGRTPFDLMPPEEKEKALENFREVANSALPFRGVTTTSYNSQGRLIFIETSGVPFFDRHGGLLGFRGITRDITERKQAEEMLHHAYDELEQRVRERTRELVIVNEELKDEIAERERAEKDARTNAALAEGLAQSVIALNSSLDLDYVLNAILEQLRRSVSFTAAGITLIEENSVRVVRYIGAEKYPETARAAETEYPLRAYSLLKQISATGQPVYIEDIREAPVWRPISGFEWGRSFIAAPLVIAGQVSGMINLVSDRPGAFSQETVSRLMSFAAPAALAVQNARLFEQVRAGHERFQLLSRRLVEVQESERRFIARELHDEASQELTAIMFGLRYIEQEAYSPDKLLPKVAELKRLTDEVLENLHHLAMNLRPTSLDHLGLVPALEQLTRDMAKRYSLNIRFKSATGLQERGLQDHVETALYRIVQEALTNTARHSCAKNVDVILESRDGKVIVIVEDDGVGFDTNVMPESNKLGLIGMQERAQMIGGSLQIETRPGAGTTIVVEFAQDS